MKFTRELFANTQSKDKILTLFQTYFQMGGMQLQITVANRDELIDAKTNPEKHRGLIVRVGGYSANFVSLSEELQDDIIRCTEQGAVS